ncbi:MAG: hypothetical protein M3340_17065 [Actinomycetota bacterium]|nr:hypothetical protein [Actinomycetota bacterium]
MKRCAYASITAVVTAMCMAATAAAAPVMTSHSGWSWGNPRPQGNELRALDFAGGRGYAVGEFGTVLRTDDGGTNWVGVRTGLVDELSRLRVLDSDTFLVGGGCTLLRSDDAGVTLRRLRFNPSATCASPLAAMHFANTDVGYLVRVDGSVLRTADGGQRFASRTTLPPNAGGPPNDAWFTGPDTGVVLTGTDTLGRILRTTDGGNSWSQVATAGALRGVHFVSPTVGYAVGQNSVMKTDDGGATWTNVHTPSVGLRSVRCVDEQHCVVVGQGTQLLWTDDGFETLNPAGAAGEAILIPLGGANAAAYASPTRAVSVGGRDVTRTSDDGGKTYSPVSAGIGGNYTRLRLTSQSTVFAPGASGSVARTNDSGATWDRVGAPTTNDIVDVAFPTAGLGYAVDTDGAVFRTDDGGASWAILGESGVRPRAISASGDGNTVLLFGPTGIRRSANGGANFDPVESRAVVRAGLDDVDRTADNAIYAYGKRAIVFSTNEGQSWTAMRRPSSSAIEDVDFVDRKTGYVLTSGGRLWRTTNRGVKWAEIISLGQANAYELAFGDKNNGYLAIDGFGGLGAGWVLHTSDGGASWRPQLVSKTPLTTSPGSLTAAPGDVAYALVGFSDMLTTGSGGDAATASALTLSTKTRRLARKGKVRVDGKVAPAAPGALVSVSTRELTSGAWRRQIVPVRSDGTFATNWTVRRSAVFVAQWAGDQGLNGDGSPPLRVTVGRR